MRTKYIINILCNKGILALRGRVFSAGCYKVDRKCIKCERQAVKKYLIGAL